MYSLEAHTVKLVDDHGLVTVASFSLPCFDDSGPPFEGVFTLSGGSVNVQQFLESAGNSSLSEFSGAYGSSALQRQFQILSGARPLPLGTWLQTLSALLSTAVLSPPP